MRKQLLKRLDEILADDGERCDGLEPSAWQELREEWLMLRAELVDEHCENCACWDSDPSSAPEIKIPEKTHVRVCFDLTLQDWFSGEFHANGAVATASSFGCSHFEPRQKAFKS